MTSHTEDKIRPIAIVGIAGRFPGEATGPDELWNMCARADDAWSPIPSERFNAAAFYHPDGGRNGSTNVRGGFFLQEDMALFDAPFFGMTKAEAAALDPQQRLLLECCYEAFENAGNRMDEVSGTNIGVFVGSFCKDWGEISTKDPDAIPMYSTTGSGQAMLSNRLSYFFDLRGPSFTIDTACSASLVALHLACQSLRAGECTSALVGGVNCLLNPDMFVSMSSMRFLSPDGRSHTFDERANGYARGEGVACVVLKPLDEALRNGDPIRAVIRNTGINQDGRTPGITFPSAQAQVALIRQVYQQAGLDPVDTTYVEAHGTGTQAGDPVEASALFEAFGRDRPLPSLPIGSVKTNVGHLEGASGVTGLVKMVMMLEKELILPNSGFKTANKRIPLEEWNLEVPTKCSPWKRTNGILRGSLNSFGYGGTNAHVIVDDAYGYLRAHGLECRGSFHAAEPLLLDDALSGPGSPPEIESSSGTDSPVSGDSNAIEPATSEASSVDETDSRIRRLFVLSAYDELSGKQYLDQLQNYLQDDNSPNSDNFLASLARTLGKHRTMFPWKASVTASSRAELVSGLQAARYSESPKPPTIGFIFTGQGAQWHAMGRELLEMPKFRESLALSNDCLSSLGATWSVLEELCRPAESTRVNEAALSQPLCTILQIALVDILRSWGVTPAAVVGHSSGEIAAAYTAGALTRHDAVAAAYYRGLVMIDGESAGKGGMAAVSASESDVLEVLSQLKSGIANIACYNSPASFTVSGDEDAIDELIEACSTRGLSARRLVVGVAYHSPHMETASGHYREALGVSNPATELTCNMFSSVYGKRLEANQVTADYWVDNMVRPVRFSEALATMCTETKKRPTSKSIKTSSIDMLVEIGPHGALSGPVRQILQATPSLNKITYLSALTRKVDAMSTLFQVSSRVFDRGYPVDIAAVNRTDNSEDHPRILVDLPSYVWNHSKKYWAEPREHLNYRLKKWPRHDLLGAPVRFANPLQPRWRNWIRLSELPWLRDHRVQSLVVYPGAGYLCMAIEAARQQSTDLGLVVESYHLREISFSQALVIAEPGGEVETMLCMKAYSDNSQSSSTTWDEFTVYSSSDEGVWVEHCRGLISVRQKKKPNDVSGLRQAEADLAMHLRQRTNIITSCTSATEGAELYEETTSMGLEYGPSFANLTRARTGPSGAVATVVLPDINACMPANYHSPFVIHPTTFDACLHVSLMMRLTSLHSPVVPTFISDVFVSDTISNVPGSELEVFSRTNKTTERVFDVSLDAYDMLSPDLPKFSVQGLQMTSLGGQESKTTKKTYYQVNTRPDPSMLSSTQITALCAHLQSSAEEEEILGLIEEVAYYMADRATALIPESVVPSLTPKNYKLYKSVQRLRDDIQLNRQQLPYDVRAWVNKTRAEQDAVWETVRRSGDEGHLVTLVGGSLSGVILGEIDPLALTMQDDALGKYYANNPRMVRQYQQAAVYVDLLAHKNPHLRVLEIGSGTGGATIPILSALGGFDNKPPRFLSYDVTDITSGFFDKVQQKVMPWKDGLIHYKRLDIENDPTEQGFEEESYDLIVAANVLHATKNMTRTMTNVRKLLKPGGNLMLIELMRRTVGIANIWGIFDGWWIAEEEDRRESPLLTEETWDKVLRSTGFTGLDIAIADTPNAATHQGTTMVSTASAESISSDNGISNTDVSDTGVVVIVEDDTPGTDTEAVAGILLKQQRLGGTEPTLVALEKMQNEGRVCIVLELDASILSTMTEDRLNALKRVFLRNKGVLWVTRGAFKDSTDPELNLIPGLLRTLRVEAGNTLVHLDLDPESDCKTAGVGAIVQIYEQCFAAAEASTEYEFVERDGVILIPRYVEDMDTGNIVASKVNTLGPETGPIVQPGRPLKLRIAQPGLLDTLLMDDDVRMSKDLGDNEVEIEVKASALNFRDVMMAMGQIEMHALGCECSGLISRVGPAVESLSVGDRVIAFADGTFSTFTRAAETQVVKIPKSMTFESATTLPIVYGTAWRAIQVAQLVQGETVLIHAASGGLGQALIMLCQYFGAEIFTTVGTVEKREFLKTQYGIPESHIFYSRDDSFAKDVMRATAGAGVDIIFNSISAELLRVTWQCIAPFGRFIELGKRDFAVNSRLEMAQFAPNVTFAAVDLVHLLDNRPRYGIEAWTKIMDLMEKGSIRVPQPISVFGMSEIEKALRIMQSGRHIGKLVLTPKEGETFPIMPRRAVPIVLSGDATYLLVGGFGGIGRALAVRLVKLGARHLIFLSRSGSSSEAAATTIKLLRQNGAEVSAFKCDISNKAQVEEALQKASQTHPPIKGLVHLGLVIRNALFEKMTLDDWTESLAPKVRGTWNLHELLPANLDFFILLSSMVATFGNPSQAAYAAASSFQDAFANYRNSLGLPASTVDLGMVTGIGYVAERGNVESNLRSQGFDEISETECMAIIEAAIAQPFRPPGAGNILTGLGLGRFSGGDVHQAVYQNPMFSHARRLALLPGTGGQSVEKAGDGESLRVREVLRKATSLDEAQEHVLRAIQRKLASLLMMAAEEVDAAKTMSYYGLDSLIAVEMRNWISSEVETTVAILELLGNQSILELSHVFVRQSRLVKKDLLKD